MKTGASQTSGQAGTVAEASQIDPGIQRYTRTAVLLHWAIAVLALVTIPLGIYSADAEGRVSDITVNIHKCIGIVVLFLTVTRIVWRLSHPPPLLPQNMSVVLRLLARFTHGMFYVLLLVLPVSGWWMTSAFPERHPFGVPGLLEFPFLPVPLSMNAAIAAHDIHHQMGTIMLILVLLHITAVLKHHFVEHDGILGRMTCWNGPVKTDV